MKALKNYINEGLLDDIEDVLNDNIYKPKNKKELIEIIDKFLTGGVYDLNSIDTSKIKDMSELFNMDSYTTHPLEKHKYILNKIDISKWNVSNVIDMNNMFSGSNFNGDISKWNVSKVKYMCNMFAHSEFNNDISKWNVSNVKDMSWMFNNSEFNNDISKWDVSNVKLFRFMFLGAPISEDKNKYPKQWQNK